MLTRLQGLALPLFVPGVFTDHAHNALALDQLALIANPADARTHFHGPPVGFQSERIGKTPGYRSAGNRQDPHWDYSDGIQAPSPGRASLLAPVPHNRGSCGSIRCHFSITAAAPRAAKSREKARTQPETAIFFVWRPDLLAAQDLNRRSNDRRRNRSVTISVVTHRCIRACVRHPSFPVPAPIATCSAQALSQSTAGWQAATP